MLHPTEKKLDESTDLLDMIDSFKRKGGQIVKVEDNVSSHLTKSKYVKRK